MKEIWWRVYFNREISNSVIFIEVIDFAAPGLFYRFMRRVLLGEKWVRVERYR
jgi:hypothetical protein